MKKLIFFAVIATLLSSASYAKAIPGGYGGAYPYNGSFSYSFDGVQFYNTCTNEMMTLEGAIQIVYHGVYNANKSKFSFHLNAQGIKAVGESGRQYRISATNNAQSSSSYNNGVYTVKGVINERWTTPGKGNNFTINSTYNFSWDGEGNFTVKRDSFEVHCQ
jgi:hypothetical protein